MQIASYTQLLSKKQNEVPKKMHVVLKNNAYGHGLSEIAELASEYGIKHAVVNTLKEANIIDSLFESILVLQDTPKDKIQNNIILECPYCCNTLKY